MPISQLRNELRKFPSSAKSTPVAKILQASKWAAKMFLFFFNGLRECFYFFLPLQDDLQATKWFAKTLCKAMGSCKNANRARNHASKEESPLIEITHKASHSISYLLKPSRPIAPAEETMPPKKTTKAEVKVLIQPTQEATTNASAP